jgi:hypothetical protein
MSCTEPYVSFRACTLPQSCASQGTAAEAAAVPRKLSDELVRSCFDACVATWREVAAAEVEAAAAVARGA